MSEQAKTQGLDALVDLILGLADDGGSWTVPTELVFKTLGVRPERFWRTARALASRIGFMEAVDGFAQATAGDLITILENLDLPDAEEAFSRAGLFLPHRLRVELGEEFLFRARLVAEAHALREDDLEAMLRYTKDLRRAIALYLEEHVDLDAMIDQCAESFRLSRGIGKAGTATAARFIRRMFSRQIFERSSLLSALASRLELAAALHGWWKPEAHPDEQRGADSSGTWALRVMGFSQPGFSIEELRGRYRELMMLYHPDVNPAGLERCKDISAAYSLLMSQAAIRSA